MSIHSGKLLGRFWESPIIERPHNSIRIDVSVKRVRWVSASLWSTAARRRFFSFFVRRVLSIEVASIASRVSSPITFRN
ncbi:MAG TPA: hypothetical protein VJU84_20310 [Pyrinomonadaceae bacterium]|nr:hypothetical protein [Pyrinomonadaceae bacterium]